MKNNTFDIYDDLHMIFGNYYSYGFYGLYMHALNFRCLWFVHIQSNNDTKWVSCLWTLINAHLNWFHYSYFWLQLFLTILIVGNIQSDLIWSDRARSNWHWNQWNWSPVYTVPHVETIGIIWKTSSCSLSKKVILIRSAILTDIEYTVCAYICFYLCILV